MYPVVSRRSKGLSIGINLNPDRICNFDCVYCCVDRTEETNRPQLVNLNIVQDELATMLSLVASERIWNMPPFDQTPDSLRRLNDIAFSGDGEPTSSLGFGAACELAHRLLKDAGLHAKIVVITNATLLERPRVQRALTFLDSHNGEIWAKLDAGNEAMYGRMVRSSIPFTRILQNIQQAGQQRDLVIQSMFLNSSGQPPEEREIADYLERLAELKAGGCRIRLVQVYTVARPVFEAHITPAPDQVLDAIVTQIRALGLDAEAYYAAPSNR